MLHMIAWTLNTFTPQHTTLPSQIYISRHGWGLVWQLTDECGCWHICTHNRKQKRSPLGCTKIPSGVHTLSNCRPAVLEMRVGEHTQEPATIAHLHNRATAQTYSMCTMALADSRLHNAATAQHTACATTAHTHRQRAFMLFGSAGKMPSPNPLHPTRQYMAHMICITSTAIPHTAAAAGPFLQPAPLATATAQPRPKSPQPTPCNHTIRATS
jgi:hypothetical protein